MYKMKFSKTKNIQKKTISRNNSTLMSHDSQNVGIIWWRSYGVKLQWCGIRRQNTTSIDILRNGNREPRISKEVLSGTNRKGRNARLQIEWRIKRLFVSYRVKKKEARTVNQNRLRKRYISGKLKVEQRNTSNDKKL